MLQIRRKPSATPEVMAWDQEDRAAAPAVTKGECETPNNSLWSESIIQSTLDRHLGSSEKAGKKCSSEPPSFAQPRAKEMNLERPVRALQGMSAPPPVAARSADSDAAAEGSFSLDLSPLASRSEPSLSLQATPTSARMHYVSLCGVSGTTPAVGASQRRFEHSRCAGSERRRELLFIALDDEDQASVSQVSETCCSLVLPKDTSCWSSEP